MLCKVSSESYHPDTVPRAKGQFDGDQRRDRHNISVTQAAWDGLEALAEKHLLESRSDVIDAVGRGELTVIADWELAVQKLLEQVAPEERKIAQRWIAALQQQLQS